MITMTDLVEQLRSHYHWEDGLIDPVDWDRFTCEQLLAVCEGRATIEGLAWGQDDPTPPTEEEERAKLDEWNRRASAVEA